MKLAAIDNKIKELDTVHAQNGEKLTYEISQLNEALAAVFKLYAEEQIVKQGISDSKTREIQLLKSKLGSTLEKEL